MSTSVSLATIVSMEQGMIALQALLAVSGALQMLHAQDHVLKDTTAPHKVILPLK